MKERVLAFLELARQIKAVVNSRVPLETQEHLLFTLSDEQKKIIDAVGLRLEEYNEHLEKYTNVCNRAQAIKQKEEELQGIDWLDGD